MARVSQYRCANTHLSTRASAAPPAIWKRRRVKNKVVVVEDNDLNRKLFCDLLAANGYEVAPVADGREAIATALDFSPDLVIMDIQLSEISGLALIEAMKADPRLQDIPVLAVTAYAGKGDEDRIREAGAEGYLAKPVSINFFMDAVNTLMDQRAAA